MTEFRKYTHVERYGNDEVQGIELGECYIFPKIDGTNASVWSGPDGHITAGSRNRELSFENDNAGFYKHVSDDDDIKRFLIKYPHLRLYGEWLVPHSLKTYREDAWRKFYIFDVYDDKDEVYLAFEVYRPLLEEFNITLIHPISIIHNSNYDQLIGQLEKNVFLINEGAGIGEGIVIKNYDYRNRFGNTGFAKMVTNAFKEKHVKEMGASIMNGKRMVEDDICKQIVDKHFVEKTYSKIVNEQGGWNSKYIPRLLQTVYYDLVNEEIWNMTKKMKNPTINFRTLQSLTTMKIKELMPELF